VKRPRFASVSLSARLDSGAAFPPKVYRLEAYAFDVGAGRFQVVSDLRFFKAITNKNGYRQAVRVER